MYCPSCGDAVAEGEPRCARCGAELPAPTGEQVRLPPAATRVPHRRRWRIVLVAVVAVLGATGSALGAFLILGNGAGEPEASPGAPTTTATAAPAATEAPRATTAPGPAETTSTTEAPAVTDAPATTAGPPTTSPPPSTLGPGERPGEIFLEPVAAIGPDPYADAVLAAPVDPALAPALQPTARPVEAAGSEVLEVEGRTGDTPGLYGGTRDGARCDAAGILDFLETHPQKAAAWIGALNSDPDLRWNESPRDLEPGDLPAYFAELTPVLLTEHTVVTNHGYRAGEAVARRSLLQAGTAVLVDLWGVPRVRCACGNPLIPPRASPTTPSYVGTPWSGLETEVTVEVQPAGATVNDFMLTDVQTGEAFARPVGTGGTSDADAGFSQDGVTVVAGPGAYPPTAGVELEAPYDAASFTVYIDPATTDWIAFSGADRLVDQPAGSPERVADGVLDIVFPDVDDFLVVIATVNGIDSGPYVIHDRDAMGTPIGDQAVIYGSYPSVWYVSRIDWSTNPPTSYTVTGPEEGDMTSFIDAQGAGEYRFDVIFYNQWTDWVAHGPLYLLVGSAMS